MRLQQLATWSHGKLVGQDKAVQKLTTDTRQLSAGDAFLALRGERFDGHQFLDQAANQGATAAVTEQATTAFADYVQVSDSRQALGYIGKGWCDQFSMPRVAVTGNAGKTSVKEMIAVLLGDNTLATAGNFNNDIGVPLTLLRANADHQYGVFELGANHSGEIAWTVSLVQPEVVLITNVTGAHLEGFGTMQGIANAKVEIIDGAAEGARVVINSDDHFAGFFADHAQARQLKCVTVSSEKAADFVGSDWHEDEQGSHFTLQYQGQSHPVSLPWAGKHQLNNALQAIAAVAALGLDIVPLLPRLQQLKPVAGRMVVHACDKGQLVDDSYNANPGSVVAAGRWLANQPAPRLYVLGGVAELGTQSAELHQQMGQDLAALSIDTLATVGQLAEPAAQGFGKKAQAVATRNEVLPLAQDVLNAGGTVLIKGSRSAAMDKVVDALLHDSANNKREVH